MAVISTIQLKRGTKAALEKQLAGINKPVSGEPIYEIDTNKLKIGDGAHNFADLPYVDTCDCEPEIEFRPRNSFPIPGEIIKIYIATDELKAYIWNKDTENYELIGCKCTSTVVRAETKADFPAVGDEHSIYIATDDCQMYFWQNGYKQVSGGSSGDMYWGTLGE